MIKLVAFDLFNTVMQMDGATREEMRAYIRHIKQDVWQPLVLPDSWTKLLPFADSQAGLELLRSRFMVVTMSNAPLEFTARMLKNCDLRFDAITPLEGRRVFKPRPESYACLRDTYRLYPEEICMVSANKDFGDIEGARKLGMRSELIRNPGCPQTIIELAGAL